MLYIAVKIKMLIYLMCFIIIAYRFLRYQQTLLDQTLLRPLSKGLADKIQVHLKKYLSICKTNFKTIFHSLLLALNVLRSPLRYIFSFCFHKSWGRSLRFLQYSRPWFICLKPKPCNTAADKLPRAGLWVLHTFYLIQCKKYCFIKTDGFST